MSCPLTRIELAHLRLAADGLTQKQIAIRTQRSASTVRTHLHNAYQKLEVPGQTPAVLMCMREGWLDFGIDPKVIAIRSLRDAVLELADVLRDTGPVTAAQTVYLEAFAQWQRAPTSAVAISNRREMLALIRPMRAELGLEPDLTSPSSYGDGR